MSIIIYKELTNVLTKRLEKTLEENHPREQAGFRCGYSTTDHIHVVNQLKEKCRYYNIPFCIAFFDYEKAFHSMQTQAVLTSLQERGIEDVYIELLKEIYTNSPPSQRKQHNQHQQRSTTGRYHLAQVVHSNTRKNIPTAELGNQ